MSDLIERLIENVGGLHGHVRALEPLELPVVAATPTANAVPKAGASGKLAAGWLPSRVVAMGYRNGSQSLVNGAVTRIDYNVRMTDPLNTVTTGATWVFTVPYSGWFLRVAAGKAHPFKGGRRSLGRA